MRKVLQYCSLTVMCGEKRGWEVTVVREAVAIVNTTQSF